MFEIIKEDIDALESDLEGILFDKDRRDILMDNTSFDVQACPGSGKTTLLAAKLMILSKKWRWQNKGVCVLSHTNVAKDEIIKRLKQHPTGWRFLEFPHFIGTIQEFVNKFLAIPNIKNEKLPIKSIDNDIYQKKCDSKLSYGTKSYLEKKFCSPLDLMMIWDGQKLTCKVPGFEKKSESKSYKNLVATKQSLLENGYFQFREMYAFAEANLFHNTFLKKALQSRFKLVLIDEVQDTQKHQKELIEKIFPRNIQGTIVQRYGDADQAIYDGMSDEPNDSFNEKNCKYRINDSHRFSPCIANLVRGLSFSKIKLESSHKCINKGNHVECANFGNNLIYVYNDEPKAKMIPKLYCDHLSHVFDAACSSDLKVSAVGAIGKESKKDFHFRIDKYFEKFTKAKQSSTPQFNSFYECVAFAAEQHSQNIKENYDLLTNCLLRFLYGLDVELNLEKKQNNLNRTNFLFSLKQDQENLRIFNKTIGTFAISKSLLSPQRWESEIQNLLNVLKKLLQKIPSKFSFSSFWSYPTDHELEKFTNAENFNVLEQQDGIAVVFNTIHGVKGQTHDATLVLETKYQKSMDIKALIKNFSNSDSKCQDKPQSKKFMKQLYVAMSRPKKVLCLAVHKDSIAGYEDDLRNLGWKIVAVNEATS